MKKIIKILKRKKVITMNKGLYIVVSGPSGVGKGTICKRLIEDLKLEYSISMTTRDIREGEIDKVNYYFTNKEDFENRIKNNEFIEYATYNDNYYGTLKKEVIDKLEMGKNIICEIEVQGAKQIRALFPDALLIYILPPSFEELRNRLINRNTEDIDTINKRLDIANAEKEYIDIYDYVVVNDDIDVATDKIKKIITDRQKANL